ncbi:cytochrome P450 [Sphaerisporangium krabiense]|nr:cytochrome P450 [Sphaerisporangium krabiense]
MSFGAHSEWKSPDLSDPLVYTEGDAEALWAAQREREPVFWTDRAAAEGFWSVLSHPPANDVLRDSETFVSSRGMRLDSPPVPTADAAGSVLIVSDPPRHGSLRRIVSSAFTPRTVRRLEATIRTTAVSIVENAVAAGEFDAVEMAARLPVSVICDMLGVPPQDWESLLRLSITAFGSGGDREVEIEANSEILLYFEHLVKLRRKDPGDDVVSAFVHAEVDGVPFSDDKIILNCNALFSAGTETTRHASVGGLLAFIDFPGQWARLRENPDLMPTAVQEILRYSSPILHVMRTAVADTRIGDREISAGDRVAVWLPAVNRDETVFDDPLVFDVGRDPNRHLALSAGPHFCLGSSLAITELGVLFEELLKRADHAEHAGTPRRMPSNFVWGFETAPVRLARRRAE